MPTQLYRRDLPHILPDLRPTFVTFSTRKRFELSPEARKLALECCLHDHDRKAFIHAAVVMPDHVHLVLSRMLNPANSEAFTLEEIMQGIKGASAHAINKLLRRRGHIWQDESFDNYLRTGEALNDKLRYVVSNPVRAGLAQKAREYPWLWTADPRLFERLAIP